MEEQSVSYETLQELLRAERRSNRITPLPNGFWADLRTFLREIEDEFREAQARDPFDRKVMMLTDRIKNARHAAETVWALRERKLAMLALAHAKDSDEPEGLTKKEVGLYERIHTVLREGRRAVFEGTAAEQDYTPQALSTPPRRGPAPPPSVAASEPARAPATPEPVPPAQQVPSSEVAAEPVAAPVEPKRPPVPEPVALARSAPPTASPEPADLPASDPPSAPGAASAKPAVEVPSDTPDDGMVTIRALGEIPPFVGPDMDTYHLQEGDMATVPQRIADLLTKRGKAEVIGA